ncbi:hypothetical protein E4U17_005872 [Claviceps sp. LM77 group G4]|nr:hypothetical protein E4U17_005872 [Claviceps sp. LM77 group G4]KAG6067982.1 hypothetical protein E4U33_005152 [Claviceps sp. LM78 group G4]KAG6081033.1 hypothetical protein E4U16_007918 [Claviceps sp. LM84 group G4]
MSTRAEIQADTLKRFIAGWSGWTMESFFATLSDDFTQKPLPLSAGHPARGREELYPRLSSLMTMMTNFKLTIHNTIHDPSNNTAALYAIADGDTPFGPYHNEQAVFLWFNPKGDKVARIEELFDTAVMADFMPKFKKWAEENPGAGAERPPPA